MNLPTKDRKWVKEVQLAFSKAEKEAERQGIDILDIYKLAPKYMAKNRKIESESILREITNLTESEYARELPLEPTARNSYLFHFVMYYVHCHKYADICRKKSVTK